MRKLRGFVSLIFLISCLSVGATVLADVKIKSRTTMSGGVTSESTTYIKGQRQRSEHANSGNEMVSIEQCDLRRTLQVIPQAQTYKVDSWEADGSIAQQQSASSTQSSTTAQKGGLITTTVTTKDTGERKKMFGYTARRIITTIETVSSPDACTPVKSRMETDGWYIDAEFASGCAMNRYANYQPRPTQSGCQDRVQTRQVGTAKPGYPVYTKMTMFDESGAVAHTYTSEVIELSQATLDAALFDVPAGYREVKDTRELYTAMARSNSGDGAGADDASADTNSGMNANVKNLATATSAASTEVGAKKPGVIRLGLVSVKTGAVGDGMNATDLATAIGNTLTGSLKAQNVEVVQLEAGMPSQADLEARQKECDFVIFANVSHKKGGGGFGGMFGKVAPALSGVVPLAGSSAGTAAASSVVYTAASISTNVKAKDELTLDVKLQAPGNAAPALSKQVKAKAKSDGQDIISPLVGQIAQEILNATRQP